MQNKHMMLRWWPRILFGLALLICSGAHAQNDWPNRPVRIVVNGSAGSTGDIAARLLADSFTKTFKQSFIVDNRAGANGMLGSEFVAKQPADGYTLLLTYTAAMVVNPVIYDNVRYDLKDFSPVAQVGSLGTLLVVPTQLPVHNLAQFITYLKSKSTEPPSYGSWGTGSGGHLSMEALLQRTGQRMVHVPYRTVSAAAIDLVSHRLDSAFLPPATALPFIEKGQIRAIAITGSHRSPDFPDIKTMTEQGIAFDLTAWYGLFAPSGTSPSIVNKLNEETRRVVKLPQTQERWHRLGFLEMASKTVDQFSAMVLQDAREWREYVRIGHIRGE